ncbi:MAG: hypothetical protein ACYDAQ_00035 [Mycobacteriales bacterium]
MSQEFGPFSVDPAQVAGLGGALFQNLVSRLLAAEVAKAGMAGSDLHTSYKDNIGDQGVDAGIYSAAVTSWIPAGDSAWQFKAGDLGPESCAAELEGATRAREIIANGGMYRIVLGKALADYQIDAREKALREKAAELGYDASGDNLKVIDGNQLARWVEDYPQLAVSTVLRGIGNVAIAFDKWRQSSMHQAIWVPSDDRDELQATIQTFLADAARQELRIEGVSGLGKTRGVLEALRGSPHEPLVLYVGDADDLNYPLIDYLTGQNRSAVIVIDECTRKRHNVFAQQLQTGAQVKLITIGERDTRGTQSVPIVLSTLPDDVIDKILTQNKPTLWAEARRVVVANCVGNVRWAMNLADAVLADPKINVGSLIDAEVLQLLVGDLLSGAGDFLAVGALALFTRYGIDREMRVELEQISNGLAIPIDELMAATHKLEQLGLVTKHGRYRSVAPQPLALYLANRAWDALGEQIVGDLLPNLDSSLAEQLFLRAADLGSSGPAARALNRILGPDGPFRSLEALSEGGASRLLIQLAIVCPDDVAKHLSNLIREASNEQLRDLSAPRRDLVWTLEKLVWHSATFEIAAHILLRLALAENETWSNNSTGTWISLFGAMLPATAAVPSVRMAYLERLAADEDPAVRRLAARGAQAAIDVGGGSVMVSGELQGGVVVEPRGTPQTYGEAWEYVRAGIKLLVPMAGDDDADVREIAEKALINAIHPLLENVPVRETLFDALVTLPEDGLRKVRTEVKHLYALFTRVEKPEFIAATDSEPDVAGRRAGLDLLNARLPDAAPVSELSSLAFAKRWEWEDGELQRSITNLATSMPHDEAATTLMALLLGSETPEASFEMGAALYAVAAGEETLLSLAQLADQENLAPLTGYLHASLADSNAEAFDGFLDGPIGTGLEQTTRLALTVRGPQSTRGWSRLLEIMKVLPVHVGAPRMFGWHVGVDEWRIAALLDEWLNKMEVQADYSFATDVVAMMVYQRPHLSGDVEARIAALVELRSRFPDLGQQSWDWVQLARRQLSHGVSDLLLSLLQQADAGTLNLWEGSEERALFRELVSAAGAESLDRVLQPLLSGSWRLQMDFRGWLADVYDSNDVIAWIGQDVQRARVVASLTTVQRDTPSELVRFLLESFDSEDEIASSLYGNFISGGWTGNESDRISGQIAQLERWVASRTEPPGVKKWAAKVIDSMKRRRDAVLEEEAEGHR